MLFSQLACADFLNICKLRGTVTTEPVYTRETLDFSFLVAQDLDGRDNTTCERKTGQLLEVSIPLAELASSPVISKDEIIEVIGIYDRWSKLLIYSLER